MIRSELLRGRYELLCFLSLIDLLHVLKLLDPGRLLLVLLSDERVCRGYRRCHLLLILFNHFFSLLF